MTKFVTEFTRVYNRLSHWALTKSMGIVRYEYNTWQYSTIHKCPYKIIEEHSL